MVLVAIKKNWIVANGLAPMRNKAINNDQIDLAPTKVLGVITAKSSVQNLRLPYFSSLRYYIIIHIYICIISYHSVYIISVNTKTSFPLHNLQSKIIVQRWWQIEALLVTNRAGSQIEAFCGHKLRRSHKLKRVTNRAVTRCTTRRFIMYDLFATSCDL